MAATKATSNNTANVSVGGGVLGGYLFSAPMGTPLPTDIETKLDDAFEVLGFVSEDGIVETEESDAENLSDMNGTTVVSSQGARAETWKITVIEIKRGTMEMMHGSGNVTDEEGLIVVKHNALPKDQRSYVMELVLRDNRRWRKVIPNGITTALGDLTINKTTIVGREVTITGLGDEEGNTCIDYIQSTETEAAE